MVWPENGRNGIGLGGKVNGVMDGIISEDRVQGRYYFIFNELWIS